MKTQFSISDLEKFLQSSLHDSADTCIITDDDTGECAISESCEVYLSDIILKSEIFDVRGAVVALCDMPMGECHQNIASIYNDPDEFQDGDRIFTGYAINDYCGVLGEWFPHSWIVDKDGKIVESFNISMAAYVGFELKDEMLYDFISCWENYAY
jgi:hypothetical protein